MAGFALDWANMLARWFHVIIGIGWIGASFFFIGLDLTLRRREKMNEGVFGTSWLVHGGGFYHVEKYLVAPAELPPELHWYKWEAYLTFVSGFSLMILQYYWNASQFLVDPAVLPLAGWQAVAISIGSLLVGWFAYDALCRSPLGRDTGRLAAALFVLIVAAAAGFTHVFSGRGAFIHVGAMVGTMMAANVFRVIIPNQRVVTADLLAGRAPDPKYGKIAKQRSVHNNYLTLPVVLFMLSNHYPMLYSHPHAWLVVAFIVLAGALVRHFINRVEAGVAPRTVAWALPAAAVALLAAIIWTAPRTGATIAGGVSDARVATIVATHCSGCHAAKPTHEAFADAGPPLGIILDGTEAIRRYGPRIVTQAVQGRVMPLGNEKGMTDAERAELGAWIEAHGS